MLTIDSEFATKANSRPCDLIQDLHDLPLLMSRTLLHLQVHIPDNNAMNYESEAAEYPDSHVSHTGQLFFPEDMYTQIESLDPYTKDVASRLRLSSDGIYNNDPTAILDIMQLDVAAIKYGVVGKSTVTVNPDSTPAAVRRL